MCEMDSGSMYGNRSVCSERATHAVTYRNGSFGPFTVTVCAAHVDWLAARAYPSSVLVDVLSD